MIAHPARDMRRRTDDPDLAVGDGDGPRAGQAFAEVADAMRRSEHRHDSAVDKGDMFRHLGEMRRQPIAPRIEKTQASGERRALGQNQLDRIGGGIDAHGDTPCARALAHQQRHLALGKREHGRRRRAARAGSKHTAS